MKKDTIEGPALDYLMSQYFKETVRSFLKSRDVMQYTGVGEYRNGVWIQYYSLVLTGSNGIFGKIRLDEYNTSEWMDKAILRFPESFQKVSLSRVPYSESAINHSSNT